MGPIKNGLLNTQFLRSHNLNNATISNHTTQGQHGFYKKLIHIQKSIFYSHTQIPLIKPHLNLGGLPYVEIADVLNQKIDRVEKIKERVKQKKY